MYFNKIIDLLRQRTMKQASDMATKSMDGLFHTLTNSFIEQITLKEEHLTERCLTQLLQALKNKNVTFIEVFGQKVYDVKESSTSLVPGSQRAKFLLLEN